MGWERLEIDFLFDLEPKILWSCLIERLKKKNITQCAPLMSYGSCDVCCFHIAILLMEEILHHLGCKKSV